MIQVPKIFDNTYYGDLYEKPLPGEEDETEEQKLERRASRETLPDGRTGQPMNRWEERRRNVNLLRSAIDEIRTAVREELQNLKMLGKSLFDKAEELRSLACEMPTLASYFATMATRFDVLHRNRIQKEADLEQAMAYAEDAKDYCFKLADQLEHVLPNFRGSVGTEVKKAAANAKREAKLHRGEHHDEMAEEDVTCWEWLHGEGHSYSSYVRYLGNSLNAYCAKKLHQVVVPRSVGEIGDELRRLGRDLTGAYCDVLAVTRDFENVFTDLQNFIIYQIGEKHEGKEGDDPRAWGLMDRPLWSRVNTENGRTIPGASINDIRRIIEARVKYLVTAVENIKECEAEEFTCASASWKDLEDLAGDLECEAEGQEQMARLENQVEWIITLTLTLTRTL